VALILTAAQVVQKLAPLRLGAPGVTLGDGQSRLGAMILDSLLVDPAELERRTGWSIKPQGACKEDRCVPLATAGGAAGVVDARLLADRLGMPLVHDEPSGLWCLGPEAGGRALTSATALELVLPDLDDTACSLASLRGTKVLLVAWASW
jgi:hypothetical protein